MYVSWSLDRLQDRQCVEQCVYDRVLHCARAALGACDALLLEEPTVVARRMRLASSIYLLEYSSSAPLAGMAFVFTAFKL